MHRNLVRCTLAALVFALLPATSFAQAQGRAYGFVTDLAGKPIPGAHLALTVPANAKFLLEAKTDKKGKYSLTVLDATLSYKLRVDAEGYQAQEGPYNFEPFGTVKVDVQLAPASAAAPTAQVTPTPRLSPEEMKKVDEARAAAQQEQAAVMAYNEGAQKFNGGDIDGAIAKFEEAARINPKLQQASSILARLYLQKQAWDKAAAAAETAIALNPADAKSMFARYEAYKALGDSAKAEAAFADLQKADPQGAADSLFTKGKSLFEAGQVQAAIDTLEQVLRLTPDHARAHYELGLCYVNRKDYAKAKVELKRFIELAPQDPDAAVAQDMLKGLK